MCVLQDKGQARHTQSHTFRNSFSSSCLLFIVLILSVGLWPAISSFCWGVMFSLVHNAVFSPLTYCEVKVLTEMYIAALFKHYKSHHCVRLIILFFRNFYSNKQFKIW